LLKKKKEEKLLKSITGKDSGKNLLNYDKIKWEYGGDNLQVIL
jgi:hypothetical protein